METRITQTLVNFIIGYLSIFEMKGTLDYNNVEGKLFETYCDLSTATLKLFLEIIDETIVSQKQDRKEAGIAVHKRKVAREILSKFGIVNYERSYFKCEDEYSFLADKIAGIEPYERVSMNVSAELVDNAAHTSYQRSARIVTDNKISRQTVMRKIRKTKGLELIPGNTKKKVKVLHIVADEDHVAMQSGKNRQVPLVTVHEGIVPVSKGRNKCVNAKHFSDYGKPTKVFWEEISAWLYEEYDFCAIERIYLHGDGASWIKQGLDTLPDCKFVLDKYHMEKAIKHVASGERREYYFKLKKAFKDFDIAEIENISDEMLTTVENKKEAEKVINFKRYIINNWSGIKIRQEEPQCGGSCTEAQISHVLSERLSRNPLGWCEEGLGFMSKLRVFSVNGGKVTPNNFVRKYEEKDLSEMEKRVIEISKQMFTDARDYSVFEAHKIVNGKSNAINTIMRSINKTGMAV